MLVRRNHISFTRREGHIGNPNVVLKPSHPRRSTFLIQQRKHPSLADRYGALGTELLAAKAADTIAVADVKMLSVTLNGFLWAMPLTDSALDAKSMIDQRLGSEGGLEESASPFRKLPLKMRLRRKTKLSDCHILHRLPEYPDAVKLRFANTCCRCCLYHWQFFHGH